MSETQTIWSELTTHLVAESEKEIEPRDLRRETSLRDDLGLSSLMTINLVLDFEDKFGITVQEEDLKSIETVGDIKDLIESKLGGKH